MLACKAGARGHQRPGTQYNPPDSATAPSTSETGKELISCSPTCWCHRLGSFPHTIPMQFSHLFLVGGWAPPPVTTVGLITTGQRLWVSWILSPLHRNILRFLTEKRRVEIHPVWPLWVLGEQKDHVKYSEADQGQIMKKANNE